MLPKLCHLDNDLVIIIIIQCECIYCVVHTGHFFSHGTPVWPWPLIIRPPPQAYSCQSAIHSNQESQGGSLGDGNVDAGGRPGSDVYGWCRG